MESRPAAASPLVALTGVEFAYDGDVAITDVDLALHAGERWAVLGPNGGGKSTLLALLLGLRRPSRGTVRWSRPPRAVRRAWVPQFPTFDRQFPIRVEEMVLEGRLRDRPRFAPLAAPDRQQLESMLHRFELWPLRRAYLTELSGGELKRAMIARALIAEPELLVLDEPSASLDEPSRRVLWELLDALPTTAAVVLATHDLAPDTFAPTRALLVDGRVEELTVDAAAGHHLLCGHRHG